MATRSPVKASEETDVTAPEEKLDFDDGTLRAIAEVYLHEANSEYRKKELNNAVYFYTEGIQVGCKDNKLIAKLQSNRATAHFYLGNHQETLNDAKAAILLEPTFIKAIERGASACVELHQFDEAITWCHKGLAINSNNKALLALRTRSVQETYKLPSRAILEKVNSSPEGHAVKSEGIHYHERRLKMAKEIGDRNNEGKAYGNLGMAYYNLGDSKKAIAYYERELEIMKELGNRAEEGCAYGNLGNAYCNLGDFKKAIHYHERCLEIAIEVGDLMREGGTYSNLGIAYRAVGDFRKAIHFGERGLKIAKEEGDMTGERVAYSNLGNTYHNLKDYQKAIRFHELALKLSKELGEKAGEGAAYSNLGNAYFSLNDLEKAIDYHERHLKICKELGDRVGEGSTYHNLGSNFFVLGDLKKAKCYLECALQFAKEVGDKVGEAKSYCSIGMILESLDSLDEAGDCFQSSVRALNEVRRRLQFKDEWKISLRHMNSLFYTCLWRLLLRQDKIEEALFAAEQGRAQALNDLIELKYGFDASKVESCTAEESIFDMLSCIPSSIVFTAAFEEDSFLWVCQQGGDVKLRSKVITCKNSKNDVTTLFELLILLVREEIGVRSGIKCEDRSLDIMRDEKQLENERSPQTSTHSSHHQTYALQTLYEAIVSPIADLVHGNELIIVPEGPLCLAPYAAFMDSNSKYLCESFRIRVIPSLSSLKLIANCPTGYHRKTGALLVGDPWVQEVIIDNQDNKLQQLPCAREEVELIGGILKTAPLIGKDATKNEVLSRLSSVALIHIAAHGRMETGEIALAPNPDRANCLPKEEDYMLTMTDVMNVQLRARLVVLSCCHSGRGEIKAEGVVGIARAFLGAGARSVLVSLWAIDDEATLEFMKIFYQHLVNGRSASEALNRAMNNMRESDKFSEVKYWAPFVLIGDDVTLEFGGSE